MDPAPQETTSLKGGNLETTAVKSWCGVEERLTGPARVQVQGRVRVREESLRTLPVEVQRVV